MSPEPDAREAVLRKVREVNLDLDLAGLFRTRVYGVEVTQSIQYFDAWRHLTDPADRGPDNSVTLVTRKPAMVRVYVRRGLGASATPVTGTLEVHKRRYGFLYSKVQTLTPLAPGSVTPQWNPGYAAERGFLGATLNFVIPASLMCGSIRLVARITSADGVSDSHTEDLDVTLRQTLRVRGIPIGYNGPASTAVNAPNLVIAAPGLADLQGTAAWALNVFPVESAGTFSNAGAITWDRPLSDAPSCAGCCTPNWVALNARVAAQVTLDGNRTDVVYYGLLATGIPMGPVIGCESSGVSAGGVGDGVTMAHEIGHHCGMPHAPCGGVGTPDPSYPAYEPYDAGGVRTASIGEYAVNVNNGAVMSPATFKDMMSYCAPRWISLHNYGRLLQHQLLDPRRECVDHWWWRDVVLQERQLFPKKWLPDPPPDHWLESYTHEVRPEPLVSIIGILHGPDRLDVTSVMQLDTRRAQPRAVDSGYVAELLGEEGEVLSSAPVRLLRSMATGEDDCGCGGPEGGGTGVHYPVVVQALVPQDGAAVRMEIRRGDVELWSRERPHRSLRPPVLEAEVREDAVELAWTSGEEEGLEVAAQWSADGGESWSALATGLAGGRAELEGAALPGGTVLVRLLVSDGFNTAVTEAVRVDSPRRGPSVALLSPTDGQTLAAGTGMRLWASVVSGDRDEEGAGADEREERLRARWSLDGEEVAEGLDAFIEVPPAGEHRLRLDVRTETGSSHAETRFVAVALDGHEEREPG